jgi:alpha-glucosidase (family GH31 glycosyl hydrolase)
VKQHTAEATEAPVQLWVYPGANGAFSFYEDDGKSFDYRKGESMRMNLAWDDRQRRLSARLARGSKMWGPAGRRYVVHRAGESATREFVFEGGPVELKL